MHRSSTHPRTEDASRGQRPAININTSTCAQWGLITAGEKRDKAVTKYGLRRSVSFSLLYGGVSNDNGLGRWKRSIIPT